MQFGAFFVFESLYYYICFQDESSTAGSPMKAPKGQAFNKKVSREKKKAVMDSGANKGIAVKSTHVCPGTFNIHLLAGITFYYNFVKKVMDKI